MRIRDFDTPVMDKVYDTEVALDERYVGETPALTKVFDLFCKFRDKYSDNIVRKSLNMAGDKDLEAFCDACAELWGFDSCSMIIKQANIFQFATFSVDMRVDLPSDKESMVEYGPNGVRFKSKYHVHLVTIGFTGLLMNAKFTNREVFAVFLHEVGHSFQSATNGQMNSLNQVNNIITYFRVFLDLLNNPVEGVKEMLELMFASNGVMGVVSHGYKAIVKNPVGKALANVLGAFSGIFDDVFYGAIFAARAVLTPASFIPNLVASITKLLFPTILVHGYGGEQMADSFAGDLGFGPDLSSAFLKSSKYGHDLDIVNKIPVLNAVVDLWCLPFEMILRGFNEHPTDGARIRGMVDIMENDLKKGYFDPKAKKALERDIKALEKTVADFEDDMRAHPFRYRQIFSSSMLSLIYNSGGGFKYNLLRADHSGEKQKAYERSKAQGNVIKL